MIFILLIFLNILMMFLEKQFFDFFGFLVSGNNEGRPVTLQSISSSLKETMNPKDIMQDGRLYF